jgi:multidrug efflux pump subunit AcrA (membrane-fusion protein)
MMKIAVVCAVFLVLGGCFSGQADDSREPGEVRVRRGAFVNNVMLSGELEAARGDSLAVPSLPNWQTAIKWLAEDGATVKAGDPVAELDNSALTADLEQKRQAAMQAAQELRQREGEWEADLEQKQLEVDKKKSDVEKTRLQTLVPKELQSVRQFEQNELAFKKAAIEHEKALDVLRSRRIAVEAERQNLLLRIAQAERDIARAEEGINALVLRAPKDGIVVIRDHWQGRKLQVGDTVFVGFPIAMLPELTSIRLKAALPDVDDGKITAGLPVTVTLDGYPDVNYTGRIASISAVAQESRRQSLRRHFDVFIDLDRLDETRMRPGLSARIIVRRDSIPSALLVPRAALDFSGKTPRARTLGGELVDVKLGACNAQDCVVTSGLEEGAKLRG